MHVRSLVTAKVDKDLLSREVSIFVAVVNHVNQPIESAHHLCKRLIPSALMNEALPDPTCTHGIALSEELGLSVRLGIVHGRFETLCAQTRRR